jgi:hypothetical protein
MHDIVHAGSDIQKVSEGMTCDERSWEARRPCKAAIQSARAPKARDDVRNREYVGALLAYSHPRPGARDENPRSNVAAGSSFAKSGRRDLNPRPPEPHAWEGVVEVRQVAVFAGCFGRGCRTSGAEMPGSDGRTYEVISPLNTMRHPERDILSRPSPAACSQLLPSMTGYGSAGIEGPVLHLQALDP